MKSSIPCEVIKDLFPSYIDKLTSEVTNQSIEKHLEECTGCREVLWKMQEPEEEQGDRENEREIDFLKKTRKRTKAVMAVSVIAIVAAILFAMTKSYFIPVNGECGTCSINVDGKKLNVSGVPKDPGMKLSSAKFLEKDGVLDISFQMVRRGMFTSGVSKSFNYQAKNEIRKVRIDGQIKWSDGEAISEVTAEIFAAGHPYIGDIAANGRLAKALGIYTVLGNECKMSLDTKEEPYGWKFLCDRNPNPRNDPYIDKLIGDYGDVLIAMVDNLSEVSFEYVKSEGSESTVYYAMQIDRESASKNVGEDIKEVGKNINKLQHLLQHTRIADYAYPDDEILTALGGEIQVNVTNRTGTDLGEIGWYLYVDGKLNDLRGRLHKLDGSWMKEGEKGSFSIAEKDIRLKGSEKLELGFDLTEKNDERGYQVKKKFELKPEFGKEYHLILTGDAKNGYQIKTV